MDRFTELQTFLAVADAGGFNAAARRLGKSPPSVTRLVAGLEARIGTRLFLRTTRQIALTEAGERLLGDARRILDELAAAEASAAGAHEAPQGVLSITAPVTFGRLYIAPVLQGFLDTHPQVTARALYVDRVVNLIDEGLDVAVRIGALPDSTMTAVRIGTVRQVMVASPDYIARFGTPDHPRDLAHHRLAVSSNLSSRPAWTFEAKGKPLTIPIAPALRNNTIDATIEAARTGWALVRGLSYQVADDVRAGRLVEVLAAFEDRPVPVDLVHAEGPLRAAKIRAFIDYAAEQLRPQAARWISAS